MFDEFNTAPTTPVTSTPVYSSLEKGDQVQFLPSAFTQNWMQARRGA